MRICLINKMFVQNDLDGDYIKEFSKLGITDEEVMIGLLNVFDSIAEIGYALYNNERISTEGYD